MTDKREVSVQSFLDKIRDICRANSLQIWNKQSLSDAIYQDLLFIYHVPSLQRKKILTIDSEQFSLEDEINEEEFAKESFSWFGLIENSKHNLPKGHTIMKMLWRQLQNSEVKELFSGRKFTLFEIQEYPKYEKKYYNVLIALATYINSIKIKKYDSNEAFTYFKKGLNKGTAKTYGQFYTPDSVLGSVVNEVKPKSYEKVLDPSCGSSSFIQKAAQYIHKEEKVDYSTSFKNLYGVEVEMNIYAEGIMNMFINFDYLPNMTENIIEIDALEYLSKSEMQYDKIVANPPFGAEGINYEEIYYKEEINEHAKLKKDARRIIKNPEVEIEIPFPKVSESAMLFWQIIVEKLKDGGKAGVVMSNTILNDAYKPIMKWFFEKCSLEKIIINPAGTFKEQGTSIETLSFIFTKGTPTTEIKIVNLGEEDKVVKTISIDQIREADWKIKVKDEEEKKVYTGGFTAMKLGDIIIKTGSGKTNSTSISNTGEYPFYGCTNIVPSGTNNKYDFDDEKYFLFAKSGGNSKNPISNKIGIGKFHLVKGKSAGNIAIYQYKIKKDIQTSYEYINYILKFNLSVIQSLAKYTTGNGNIDIDTMLNTIQIPVPPIEIQTQIVESIERIFGTNQDELSDFIKFTNNVMDLILKDPEGTILESVVEMFRQIVLKRTCIEKCKTQIKLIMQSINSRGFEMKKLGDISEINKKNMTKDFKHKNIKYIDLGSVKEGNITEIQTIPFEEKPSRAQRQIEKLNILWGSVRPLSKSYAFIDFECDDSYICSTGFIVININKDIINPKFAYYMLTTDHCVNYLNSKSTGSTYPAFNTDTISNYSIPIPSLDFQTNVLERIEKLNKEITFLEESLKDYESNAKFILESYLTTIETEKSESVDSESEESDSEEIEEARMDAVISHIEEIPKMKRIISKKKDNGVAMGGAGISPTTETYASWTVVSLKEECRKFGLKVSGTKSELSERLKGFHSS
jgi:type I restriction-modification system DNA methylase subunit/restriction endonuclease S subunit